MDNGRFVGEYDLVSGSSEELTEDQSESETGSVVDKLDDFNPADLVYDEDGIQIYKNDTSTIMLKVISNDPLKFVSLFVEKKLSNSEAISEFGDEINGVQGQEGQEQETEEINSNETNT